ncbi:Cyanovirin-N [Corynascus novoguineensis]|uniref:Cyanovirin-N n=1 Tax=Corynascus novoguineensis TaxID=1126955 RepID=A0AAN7CPW8_9PEZI|nr:Cyanovirin-N [Corynascus novoguineensis]
MKSILSLLVLGLGATGALADNFTGSCDANSIKVSGKTLTAKCKNIFGQSKCSKLNLNKCIKNVYGRLQEDPTGAGPHYGDHCIECTNKVPDGGLIIGVEPSLIYCKCDPGTGAAKANWPTAIFDLNTIVDNKNGALECFKTKSTSC